MKQDYPDALLLEETANANVNLAVDYTNKDNYLMDNIITFRYFTEDQSQIDPSFSVQYQPKSLDLVKFKQNQAVWQQTLSSVSKPTLYWNNHDVTRIATRITKSDIQARSLAMLMYLQNELPIICYGEELGVKNLEFEDATQFENKTAKEFIESVEKAGKTSQEALLMTSKTHKLPARKLTPWNNEKSNGFSDGSPWLKGKKVDYTNAADEIAGNHSMFNFYKKLIALKRGALFEDGGYYLLSTSNDSYVYERNLEDQKALVTVSLSKNPIELDVDPELKQEKLVAGNYQLKDGRLKLAPYAGVVLKRD